MTPSEFDRLESAIRDLLKAWRADALRDGALFRAWVHTIFGENLFEALLRDPGISSLAGDPVEREVAVALIILGASVTALDPSQRWGDPLGTLRPSAATIERLAAAVRLHPRPPSAPNRTHQCVAAFLLGWGALALPASASPWREAARHLLRFFVWSIGRARINWLKQLGTYLGAFDQHRTLTGTKPGIVGMEQVTEWVVRRLLDQPACTHWRPNGRVDPATLERGIREKADRNQERVEGEKRDGLTSTESAFVFCRRAHTLQAWNPYPPPRPPRETTGLAPECGPAVPAKYTLPSDAPSTDPGVEQRLPATGTPEEPAEDAPDGDLWEFVARGASGVASGAGVVFRAAEAPDTDVTNKNKIFGRWEDYAQAFTGSLLFHALNARRRTLLWKQVVHWQCPGDDCRQWKVDTCQSPPGTLGRCVFKPRKNGMAIVRPGFVRADFVGPGLASVYAPVKVWLCHAKHKAFFPALGRQKQKKRLRPVQVVYPFRLLRCPMMGCGRPHGLRKAKVLVITDHVGFIQ